MKVWVFTDTENEREGELVFVWCVNGDDETRQFM